jgi:uridine phosphorylase
MTVRLKALSLLLCCVKRSKTEGARGGQPNIVACVTSPSYPNFAGKHAEEALYSPSDFVAYLRRIGADASPVPGCVVLCYQRSLYEHVLRNEDTEPRPRRGVLHGLVPLPSTGGAVGLLGRFGIGAPVAAAALEELAALGTHTVASIGTAGSLQHSLKPGDLVLCEAAIRDEGVSHHYLPPGRLASASPQLTATLGAALENAGATYRTGTSWTIDAPYRETVAEARHYQAEGVLCVEMEAAALFAVGSVRKVRVASAFVISDSLADLEWNPQFHGAEVREGLVTLFEAAVAALALAAGGRQVPDADRIELAAPVHVPCLIGRTESPGGLSLPGGLGRRAGRWSRLPCGFTASCGSTPRFGWAEPHKEVFPHVIAGATP